MSCDVLIAGAGPAGSLAAVLLARAGLRVRLLDRATFPRRKLCGDTLNPGALAILRRHGLADLIERRGRPLAGMVVTGDGGVRIQGDYGGGVQGRAFPRLELDAAMVEAAVAAGADLHTGVAVRGAFFDQRGRVRGVRVSGPGSGERHLVAPMTIAADGRRSTIATTLSLSRHPRAPRRWAIGAYFTGVEGLGSHGEMHVRRGHYIGVAPMPGDTANACLVLPQGTRPPRAFGDPAALLEAALRGDAQLAPRFAAARRVSPAVLVGPLAVDTTAAGMPGVLLAGDASGFIDPMTGDGLRFAFRGAELAAEIVLDVMSGAAIENAHLRLATRRQQEFAAKWRLDRALRAMVSWPPAITAAAAAARVWPGAVRHLIRYAGDVSIADCGMRIAD